LGPERRATGRVSRDERMLRLPLLLQQKVTTWRIGNAGWAAARQSPNASRLAGHLKPSSCLAVTPRYARTSGQRAIAHKKT